MKPPFSIQPTRYGIYIWLPSEPHLVIRWNGSHRWIDLDFGAMFRSRKAWRAYLDQYINDCARDFDERGVGH